MAQIIDFPLAYYPSIEAAQEDVDNANAQFYCAKEQYFEDPSMGEYFRFARERLHLSQAIWDYVLNEQSINRGGV